MDGGPGSPLDNVSATTHKRKAEDTLITDQNASASSSSNEHKKAKSDAPCDAGRPLTPPPPSEVPEPPTPGRVGPYKRHCWCRPDIKPFKGPKNQKVHKTAAEKEQEYIDFGRHHEGHVFHEKYICFDKGPNGSPTYDKAGFELDYEKVAESMKPQFVSTFKSSVKSKGYKDHIEKKVDEGKRKREIFFQGPIDEKTYQPMLDDVATDKVSKYLQIPFHKVGLAEFEEWERRGYPKERMADHLPIEGAKKERLLRLCSGQIFRK